MRKNGTMEEENEEKLKNGNSKGEKSEIQNFKGKKDVKKLRTF